MSLITHASSWLYTRVNWFFTLTFVVLHLTSRYSNTIEKKIHRWRFWIGKPDPMLHLSNKKYLDQKSLWKNQSVEHVWFVKGPKVGYHEMIKKCNDFSLKSFILLLQEKNYSTSHRGHLKQNALSWSFLCLSTSTVIK